MLANSENVRLSGVDRKSSAYPQNDVIGPRTDIPLVAIKVMNLGDGYQPRYPNEPILQRRNSCNAAMILARRSCADRFPRSRVIDACGPGLIGSLRPCFPIELALRYPLRPLLLAFR